MTGRLELCYDTPVCKSERKETIMNVLCIGTAVMDITGCPISQKNAWPEKQRISSIQIQPGGDAANQSIYLAMLGSSPALAACIGTDMNGVILKNTLKEMKVDISLIREKDDIATGTALVLVGEDGERHSFSVRGAQSTLTRTDIPWELPEECRAVSLASLFSMTELERDGMLEYLQMLKKNEKLVFADLANDKLGQGFSGIKAFLPYIDYFLPSLYDVLPMTQTETAPDAAHVFRARGVKHVIIKCGARGCYCSSESYEGWIPAIPVTPVDTTGAGDCMCAVFIQRILQGDTVEAACRYACAAASCSTLFAGASSAQLTDESIREYLCK